MVSLLRIFDIVFVAVVECAVTVALPFPAVIISIATLILSLLINLYIEPARRQELRNKNVANRFHQHAFGFAVRHLRKDPRTLPK